MKGSLRSLLAFSFYGVLGVAGAAEDAPADDFSAGLPVPPQERLAEARTVFSASRRFLVSGLPPAPAAELAAWAEDALARIQRAAGTIPFARGEFIPIMVEAFPSSGLAAARADQACRDGAIVQQLSLDGLERLDLEEAYEALASLLISRLFHAQPTHRLNCQEPLRAPDWLAVAWAHASDAALRRRDLDTVLQRDTNGDRATFSEIVESHVLPPGRCPEKADATALWIWLSEQPRTRAAVAEFLRVYAEGYRPDAQWWAEKALGLADARNADNEWGRWLASRRLSRGGQSESDRDWIERLRLWQADDVRDFGAPAELAGKPLDAILAYTAAPWRSALALRAALQLQFGTVGRSEEARRVAGGYMDFLQRLIAGESRRVLERRWRQAEVEYDLFVQFWRGCSSFLDETEHLTVGSSGADREVDRFLDEVTERLRREPSSP